MSFINSFPAGGPIAVSSLGFSNVTASGSQSFSGYTPSNGEYVALSGQLLVQDNGIYQVNTSGNWPVIALFDELIKGTSFYVSNGDYAGNFFVLTNNLVQQLTNLNFLANETIGFDFTITEQAWQFLDSAGTPIDISTNSIVDGAMRYSKAGNIQVNVCFNFEVDTPITGVREFSFIAVDDSDIPLTPTPLKLGGSYDDDIIYTGRFIASTSDVAAPDYATRLFGDVVTTTTASGLKFTFIFDSVSTFKELHMGVISIFDRDGNSIL